MLSVEQPVASPVIVVAKVPAGVASRLQRVDVPGSMNEIEPEKDPQLVEIVKIRLPGGVADSVASVKRRSSANVALIGLPGVATDTTRRRLWKRLKAWLRMLLE
jgi:hypothetical protein